MSTMRPNFNLFVLGHKGHGKDEVSAILADLMQTEYISSSMVFIEEFAHKSLWFMGYPTPADLYMDRDRVRPVLYQLIRAYCIDDKARLAKLVFSRCPIYAGQRDREENQASLADIPNTFNIWVDASSRLGPEGIDSFNIPQSDAHYAIDNNMRIEDEEARVSYLRGQCRIILDTIAESLAA